MQPMFVPPNTDSGTTTRIRTSAIQSRRTVWRWMSKAAPPVSADHAVPPPVPPVHPARLRVAQRRRGIPLASGARRLPGASDAGRYAARGDCRPPGAARRAVPPAHWFHASRIGWVARAHVDGRLDRGGRLRRRLRPDRDRAVGPDAGRDDRRPARRPLGILDQEEAFAAIDLNVIFLLAGMMVIASILARTGFFDWLAIRSVMLSHGHPIRLLLILAVVTAVAVGVPRQRDDRRADDAGHPLGRPAPGHLAGALPDLVDPRLEHRRHGDAHRRPAQHPHRLGRRPRLRRLPRQPRAGHGRSSSWPSRRSCGSSFRGHLQVPDERREAALERTEENAIKDRPLLVRSLIVAGATIVGLPLPLGASAWSRRPSRCSAPWS